MAGQWTVAIYGPNDGPNEGTVLQDEILSVSVEPEFSAHWDAEIEVAKTIAPEHFRFGRMDIYSDGVLEASVEIEPPIGESDGVVTLGGRTRNTLRLTDREIEREFSDMFTEDALQQVWDQDTDFDATVHPPTEHPFSGRLVQQADGGNLADILTARHRNDEGQFVAESGGSAPNFLDTTPLEVTSAGVRQTPTAAVIEGENADDYREVSPNTVTSPEGASGQEWIGAFNTPNGLAEWPFTFKHTIPESEGAIAVRGRLVSYSGSTSSAYELAIDGQTVATLTDGDINDQNIDNTSYWWVFSGNLDTKISGGESHTLSFKTLSDGDRFYHIDVVCVYDTRFDHEFSSTTNSDNALARPAPYPPQTEFSFDSPDVGAAIEDTDLSVTVDQDNSRWSADAQVRGPTSSHVETTVTLAPNTDSSKTSTPHQHTIPQTATSMELRIDGDARSIIDSQQFAGTPLGIIQKLGKRANYHSVVEHGREDGALVAESFERGDPDMARALPPDARVTDVSQDTSVSGDYHNRVTVVGDELPPGLRREGEPRRYRATVEDTEEITANGVEQITIEDSELNTQNDVLSRARTELRKGLAADQQGGSIDTTPAIAEPGYPYRVPHLASDDVYARRIGEPIETSILGDVAGGETVTVSGTTHVWRRITIDGSVTVQSGGQVRVLPGGSVTVSDSGSLTVNDGGTVTTAERFPVFASVIPAGETVVVGAGEYVEVWRDLTVRGTLDIQSGATVHVLGSGSVTVADSATLTVADSASLTTDDDGSVFRTLETWSLSESAGDASASGEFERPGGWGGTDSAALLGLLAGD